LPTQHSLWIGPDTPPGPYLFRLGFFDRRSGERLPLRIGTWANGRWTDDDTNGETPAVDQIHLGLFYVSAADADPRLPQTPLLANFAEAIDLTGVTLPQSEIQNPQSKIEVTFHWQARQPTTKPYTVFLQLLNEQGEVVAGWDSQPLNGLYPTHLWSPGETVVDTFQLPLPEAGLAPGGYRLISGFYDFNTGQRLPVVGGGDFAELTRFQVD
jgi:hypothetical protein